MAENKIGMWAFFIGLIIAILEVFITGYATTVAIVLFILGLVVGFLNINDKDFPEAIEVLSVSYSERALPTSPERF